MNWNTLQKILFKDIETTTQYPSLSEAPEKLQQIFRRRFEKDIKELGNEEEAYNVKGPIYPEFSRIVCISIGYIKQLDDKNGELVTMSFSHNSERELLNMFFSIPPIKTWGDPGPLQDKWSISGHNVMNFDIPFIAKRAIILGLPLPAIFNFIGKKPWDIKHIHDTKEMWKMGVFDGASNSALDTLTYAFGIDSPKDDISGKDVKDVYWIEKDLKRIMVYCEKDILAQARVLIKILGLNINLTTKEMLTNA